MLSILELSSYSISELNKQTKNSQTTVLGWGWDSESRNPPTGCVHSPPQQSLLPQCSGLCTPSLSPPLTPDWLTKIGRPEMNQPWSKAQLKPLSGHEWTDSTCPERPQEHLLPLQKYLLSSPSLSVMWNISVGVRAACILPSEISGPVLELLTVVAVTVLQHTRALYLILLRPSIHEWRLLPTSGRRSESFHASVWAFSGSSEVSMAHPLKVFWNPGLICEHVPLSTVILSKFIVQRGKHVIGWKFWDRAHTSVHHLSFLQIQAPVESFPAHF